MPRDCVEDISAGDIDAQRLMERLHAKWSKLLREQETKRDSGPIRSAASPAYALDPERARRSADRARTVIAQKDRAREILARLGAGVASSRDPLRGGEMRRG